MFERLPRWKIGSPLSRCRWRPLNGAVVSGTAATGANGAAVYKLMLGRKDPVGVYQVGAKDSSGGTTVTATTSFMVQEAARAAATAAPEPRRWMRFHHGRGTMAPVSPARSGTPIRTVSW